MYSSKKIDMNTNTVAQQKTSWQVLKPPFPHLLFPVLSVFPYPHSNHNPACMVTILCCFVWFECLISNSYNEKVFLTFEFCMNGITHTHIHIGIYDILCIFLLKVKFLIFAQLFHEISVDLFLLYSILLL